MVYWVQCRVWSRCEYKLQCNCPVSWSYGKKGAVYGLRQEKHLESVGLLLDYPESNLLQKLD